jgi:hypothetical protein
MVNPEFKTDFEGSKKIGKNGETIFANWWKNTFPLTNLKDMSEIPGYQFREIDFIAEYQSGRTVPIELKSDNYQTGNFAIETIANRERGRTGWAFSSEADVLAYYYLKGLRNEPNLFFIDFETLRTVLRSNQFPTREVVKERQVNGAGDKTTVVTLVPRTTVPILSSYYLPTINVTNPHSAQGQRANR